MRTMMRFSLKMTAALLLVWALFGAGLAPAHRASAACAPTVSFDLWAKTGSATLYGATSVNFWGYSLTSGDPATLPGPLLDVTQGDCVQVTLHNTLAESSALLFQGQGLIPDTTGAAPLTGTAVYTFSADSPGTYLYEAGLIPGAQHQVAMGMYGTLIVRSAVPGQAYASADSAYDQEALIVLSEFDPAMVSNPAAFDMRKFAPKYFLINGKAYPGTDPITVTAGNKVLLRYVNAGQQSHHMSLLGFTQTVLAADGSPFLHSHRMAAETIAPGQTLDALIAPPSTTPESSKFALYDANMLLRNHAGTGANAGLGGMLALLNVTGGSPTVGPDSVGPLLSLLSLSPNPSTGTSTVTLSVTANEATTGNSNVAEFEYTIDAGTPVSIPVGSPAPLAVLSTPLPSVGVGTHLVSVRARDAWGNWSMPGNINLIIDNVGPAASNVVLNPNPSNGTLGVYLSFTLNDGPTGGSNVTAAEYWVDSGAPVAVPVGTPASLKTLTVIIPSGLSAGAHTVHVRGQDALGNWGTEATGSLVVDTVGPLVTSVSATYNPNNGTKPLNTSVQAVRVTASFSDASTGGSKLSLAEGFIDLPGTTGTGFAFVASDGNFNSPVENGFADVPLVVINGLSAGPHPFCVHVKDAAGNWSAMDCSYMLVVDKTPPAVLSITRLDPSPTTPGTVHYTVTFSEAVTGVSAANFALVRTGLSASAAITSVSGSAATWTVTAVTGNGSGTLGLNLASPTGIVDIAGNALPSAGLPFVGEVYTVTIVSGPLYFSTSGSSNPPGVSGTADDADIYFYNGSGTFSRVIDITAAPYSLGSGVNVDGFDRVDATHFYMSFSGSVTLPVVGAVQDEDVVYYNAGTWSLFFDGSANGVAATDLDAISISGGTLYFSTGNSTVPPGAGGSGDDADIYRWDGPGAFTRVVDASGTGSLLGLASGANVDGLVWVDVAHFYLSFENTSTTLPVLGAAEDEDVVFYDTGAWSTYFDGTGLGLVLGAQDLDAFDLP